MMISKLGMVPKTLQIVGILKNSFGNLKNRGVYLITSQEELNPTKNY